MYDELIKRLHRYSENCVAYKLDADFADAVQQAADAIEELQKAVNFHKFNSEFWEDKYNILVDEKWIPVAERLPEEEEFVLVVRKFLGLKGQVPPSIYVEIAYRIDDGWVADSYEYKIARNRHTDPLYWMPLPKPPKGE